MLGISVVIGAALLLLHPFARSPETQPGPVSVTFSVLQRPASSGLTLVDSAQQARLVRGPVWISTGAELEPDIAAARETYLAATRLRVWIAPVNGGGICVLVMEGLPGEKGPGSSCAPAGRVARGALLIHSRVATRPAFIVGVVPDGVPSVSLLFADGTSTTVAVKDNIYATATTDPVDSVLFKVDGVEQVNTVDYNGLE